MSGQFIVQLRSRPGELARLARALRARSVNVVGVRQGAAEGLPCVEIRTDCCDDDTGEVLRSMGYLFSPPTAAGPRQAASR